MTKAQSELAGEEVEDEEEDEDALEFVFIPDNVSYLEPLLYLLALIHSLVAFSMMVAYYCLKVGTRCKDAAAFMLLTLLKDLVIFTHLVLEQISTVSITQSTGGVCCCVTSCRSTLGVHLFPGPTSGVQKREGDCTQPGV